MNTVTDNSEVIADLIKERDELKAHCGKLFELVHDLDSYLDTNELTSIAHGSVFHQEMKHLITFTPQQSLADLIKERDELKAHCDFLTYAFNRCYSCVPDDGSSVSNECFEEFSDKLLQTPQQSLADSIKERDELKAHCEFLKECCYMLGSGIKVDLSEVNRTPQQSLADSIKERDELKAHCERLRNCLMKASSMDPDRIGFEMCLGKTLASTPQQSLARIKAQAIKEAVNLHTQEFEMGFVCISQNLIDYANHLRKQAK
jgi:hypothetical protein